MNSYSLISLQMEWMSDKVVRAFEDKRNNPFTFKHIKLCHTMAEIDALPEPKVCYNDCVI